MTALPQLLVDPAVADTADIAANLKFITLPNGNSLVIHATKDAADHRFIVRGQQFDPSGSLIGEEVTFHFPRAWGGEPPEFDAVAFGGNRVAIVSLNPFDILTIRDFEAREDGTEVFRRKTAADAGRMSGEDCMAITVSALGDGGDSLDRTSPAEERDGPEVEWPDGTGDRPAAPGITVSRYGDSPGAGRDPDYLANGRRLRVLERYGVNVFGDNVTDSGPDSNTDPRGVALDDGGLEFAGGRHEITPKVRP
ncbi:hypothetical protein [Pelagibius sp.]|uniref:hypothetical protein n=1 Tax=Pelagibius sp. TaxID=1931238 RepID=UPI00262D3C7C|nr:hypothetical protein [Pelagibius sp.]